MNRTDTNSALDIRCNLDENIRNQLAVLSRDIDFLLPFAILTEFGELLFSTRSFEAISRQYSKLMERIFQDPLAELEFHLGEFSIKKKKFATLPNDEILSVVFITDQSDDYQQMLRYTHDIQAPLRNISNFLQLIDEQLSFFDNRSVKDYLKLIITNVQKLCNLNIGYLRKDKNEYYQNFEKVINDIRSLLQTQMTKRHCDIQIIGNIPGVKYDYYDLFSLLKNLIENSLEHAIASSLIIKITKLFESEHNVRIRFEDNGAELSDGKRERIKALLEGDRESANLGLFICGSIVRECKGKIQLVNDRPNCTYDIDFIV